MLAADIPIEGKTVKALTTLSLKRTFDLFAGNHGQPLPADEERCVGSAPAAKLPHELQTSLTLLSCLFSQRLKIACKVRLAADPQ
jgi:hypothetical protein